MERIDSKVVNKFTNQNDISSKSKKPIRAWKKLSNFVLSPIVKAFKKFDEKMDGAASFFMRHYGKTKFMVSMSKKVQVLGIEKVWEKGPKGVLYFFLFYLIRDTILYIILPIYFARAIE